MLMQSRPQHTRPLELARPTDFYSSSTTAPSSSSSSSFLEHFDFSSSEFDHNSLLFNPAFASFDFSQPQQQQHEQVLRNSSNIQNHSMAKNFHGQDWLMFGDNANAPPLMTQSQNRSQNQRTPAQRKPFRPHQRTFSNELKKSPLAYSQHLPPPSSSQPSSTQPLFDNNNTNYNTHRAQMAAAVAMNSTMEHFGTDNDIPGYAHSTGHSVSSYGHDSPATPRTVNGEERDDAQHMSQADFSLPKFDRTISDFYNDELFMPANYISNSPAKYQPVNSSLLSPYRQVTEHLQAANLARSVSPQESQRKPSPFRKGSPYAAPLDFGPIANSISTAAGVRQQQKAEADARAYQQHHSQPNNTDPPTISPKDAVLDYQEDVNDLDAPLYPTTSGTDQFLTSRTAFPMASTQFPFAPPNLPTGLSNDLPLYLSNNFRQNSSSMPEAAPEYPAHLLSMETSASASSTGAEQLDSSQSSTGKPMGALAHRGGYTCTAPGCSQRFESAGKLTRHRREAHRTSPTSPTLANLAHAHKTGTIQQQSARNSVQSGLAAQTPKLEPTESESESESGGGGSSSSSSNSSSSGGAHEHSDEGEQLSSHEAGPLDMGNEDDADDDRIGSRMTSAALMARNSQAGPHRCFRINPSTGKPCDTVFSRPYDLTRHEDTIHNGYKKKVRCHLCVEEKTFSRNDALTRHMRVVHPEVDFPGKHRRRHVS